MPITLTGGNFRTPDNNTVASGSITFKLSGDAHISAGGQIAPTTISATVTSGNVTGSPTILGNDELSPSGTYYVVRVLDSSGNQIYGPENWSLTGGGTLDLGTITPLTTIPTLSINSASITELDVDIIKMNHTNKTTLISPTVITPPSDLGMNLGTTAVGMGSVYCTNVLGTNANTLTVATPNASGSNNGANLFVTGGNGGNSGGTGASIIATGGNSQSGNTSGGPITLTAGNSFGNVAGAGITINAGTGGATGVGGNLNLNAGRGGATSGISGNVNISCLSPNSNGANGGAVNITGGAPQGGVANGGNVTIKPGLATGGGTDGNIVIQNAAATVQMGMTLKKGTGGGNYTSASTTYVRVDSTNLAFATTIPTGWKLGIQASGCVGTATAAVSCNVALADGTSDNTGILVETQDNGAGASQLNAFSLSWVVNGDGASHTINLQYKTSAGADSVIIANASATLTASMVFTLMPSN